VPARPVPKTGLNPESHMRPSNNPACRLSENKKGGNPSKSSIERTQKWQKKDEPGFYIMLATK
jgi:hypothetical protein